MRKKLITNLLELGLNNEQLEKHSKDALLNETPRLRISNGMLDGRKPHITIAPQCTGLGGLTIRGDWQKRGTLLGISYISAYNDPHVCETVRPFSDRVVGGLYKLLSSSRVRCSR